MANLISILLIEDDIFDAEAVERALSAAQPPIFELSQVATFREAMQLIKTRQFHLVILDLGLPDSSGLDGLERLIEAIPKTPVVVMTGLDDDEIALRAIEIGAQEFLEKASVEPRQLVRTIRHAAKRKQCAMKATPGETVVSELETIIGEATDSIRASVGRLKATELTNEQQTLVVSIDNESIASVNRVRDVASGRNDPRQSRKHDVDVLD